jgi:uncharacterized membrane protein YkoI
MTRVLLAAAFAAAIATPAVAQSTTLTGDAQPHKAARVDVEVNEGHASGVRISGDSAFPLARAHADSGEVRSAELEMKDGRLVYEVHVLNKHKRASTVWVDANTAEVLEATEHSGLTARVMHHKEHKKLLNAKRDSAAKNL